MGLSIQEVSEQLSITPYTLRYYEKEGIIPPVTRDSRGNREYESEDIQWLELVCCFRDTGMSLSDVKRIVALSRVTNAEETLPARLAILTEHRDMVLIKIEEMRRHLCKIEKKIAYYQRGVSDCG